MKKERKKQSLQKTKQNSIHAQKKHSQKELIKVRTGIRVGSGDDFGFTSCALR